MRKVIVLFLVLTALTSIAFAALVEKDKVVFEYHGSVQWGADQYYNETWDTFRQSAIADMSEYKFSSPSYYKIMDSVSNYDLDDDDERWFAITHMNHVYKVVMEESPSGGKSVIFNVTKDGKPCGANNGRVVKTLANTSNKIIDFVEGCGISIAANWETLNFESDVKVDGVIISTNEYNKNIKEALDYINNNGLESVINASNAANKKFRVLELNNLNHFATAEGSGAYIHAGTEYWKKHGNVGKDNGLVITENNKILYFIMMKDTFTNTWVAYKPTKEVSTSDYSSYDQLKNDAILGWTSIAQEEVPDTLDGILKWGTIATVPVATATGTAYLVGTAAMTAWAVGGGTSTALATTAATSASVVGVSGGVLSGTGGSMTVIALTPVGWAIIGVAATVATVYAVYHFTTTDSIGFRAGDGTAVIMNQDPQFWTRIGWGADAKANFIMFTKPVTASSGTGGTSGGTTVTPAVGAKTGDYYYRFADTSISVLQTKGVSVKYSDIVDAMQVNNGTVNVSVVQVDGSDTIKFDNVTSGTPYPVVFAFPGFKPIAQTWTFAEADIHVE